MPSESCRIWDAIIIGAGLSGMHQLHKLRELNLSVRVLEAGGDIGGTWYWNRYPGCRFDSESYSYGYSFSNELMQEWTWGEHFSSQPETLRYLSLFADKYDIRKDVQFNSRVKSAIYDESDNLWKIVIESGEELLARVLITAMGPLSAPKYPDVEGIERFTGTSYHTSLWPADPEGGFGGKKIDFGGKRVGVIGTGCTGIQVIQEVAKTDADLFVFQRTPEWAAPLHNKPISADETRRFKALNTEIFEYCRSTYTGFMHDFSDKSVFDDSPEQRERFWEDLYASPGFGIYLANYKDILFDRKANDLISAFMAKKIRQRVKDPAIAEKLIPRYGFGTRRVPLETKYYEAYNQRNVTLVDLSKNPIIGITPDGIETQHQAFNLDIIIYATGFDAVTGAFSRINIRGKGGQRLFDKWANGPETYLGLGCVGFPNLLTILGPHNGAVFCNIPRCSEQNVQWVTDLMRYMKANNYSYVEPTVPAEVQWTHQVNATAAQTLLGSTPSWFYGDGVKGKARNVLIFTGGNPTFRKKAAEVAVRGYEGFILR